jgi:hypothetical protein
MKTYRAQISTAADGSLDPAGWHSIKAESAEDAAFRLLQQSEHAGKLLPCCVFVQIGKQTHPNGAPLAARGFKVEISQK